MYLHKYFINKKNSVQAQGNNDNTKTFGVIVFICKKSNK